MPAASRTLAAALLAALLSPGVRAAVPEPAAPPLAETFDLRYHDAHPRQVLDVIAPKGARDRPVVLFVHGGAWMFGDKNCFGLYRGVGRNLARRGYVAVMVNYRLSPAVKHPAHVQDVARAFAWTRKHIRNHGGDPERIFLAGHSAGGHLVSLLACDPAYLADPTLRLGAADRAAVRGVVSISGVYRIPDGDFPGLLAILFSAVMTPGTEPRTADTAPSVGNPEDHNPFRLVFGDDLKARRQASPITHVRKGLPPFLLLYAEHELPLLNAMAREFGAALRDAGAPVEVRRVPGCDHNVICFRLRRPGDPTAAALFEFLEKHGGGGAGSVPRRPPSGD